MEIRETLAPEDPQEFRAWLEQNHQTKIEIWLLFYKRSSGKQTLTISQAVDEALCFGWIQSRLKPLPADRFAVRFSPRRPGSYWSLPNRKRVRKLIAQGRMSKAGRAVLPPDLSDEEKADELP
jgi:uncharacterized protein YdeI (YjbR/CyaY-like superfamily)